MGVVYIGYTTVRCTLGGRTIAPYQLVGGQSYTNPTSQNKTSVTLTAGADDPQTGTLLTQGSAGAWDRWISLNTGWKLYSGLLTDKTITVLPDPATANPGYITGISFVANFTQTINPAKTWSPASKNIIVHLLGDDPNLPEESGSDSSNFVSNGTDWNTFKNSAFTQLQVASGGLTRDWAAAYTSGAYLLNVSSATFSVVPIAGSGTVLAQKVYAWKLERDGVIGTTSLGSDKSVTIADFEEGDVVHLYLTTATSRNQRIKYDGFDVAGHVPANLKVYADGAATEYDVGSVWTASNPVDPYTVFLSPVAWKKQEMGVERSAIIDVGETIAEIRPLTNQDGTGTSVTTHIAESSIKNVLFKETIVDPGVDNLTVNIVIDAEPEVATNLSVSIEAYQLTKLLGTLTATGTIDYYVGAVPIDLIARVAYGGAYASDFTLRMKPTVVYPDVDVIGTDTARLEASVGTREITFYLTQFVDIGVLTEVSIHKKRDTSMSIPVATSTGPTTTSSVGNISVEMTSGQSAGSPIFVTCVAASGYSVQALYVVDPLDETIEFAYVPITEGRTPIYLNVPRDRVVDDGGIANIKVVLVVVADVIATPIVTYVTAGDNGKFMATLTNGTYGDFRVGDLITLNVSPVGALTGLAIGSPYFNGVEMTPIRTGVSVTLMATLSPVVTVGINPNIFKIPVYATFTPSTNPESEAAAIVRTEWRVDGVVVDNKLTITDTSKSPAVTTTYYRIGMTYTVATLLTSGGYTVISAQINLRLLEAGTAAYYEIAGLAPVVSSLTERTFSGILQGETQCIATFASGAASPYFSVAAFDYGSNKYIITGERPGVTTVAVLPAVFSDNQIDDEGVVGAWSWPGSGTPGSEYKDAAFLVRSEETPDPCLLLPQLTIRVSYTKGATLERWNAVTSQWVPYIQTGVTLASAFTYFRVCIGTPPTNLVSVKFKTAENTSGVAVPGGIVSVTSGTTYDTTFTIPTVRQLMSRVVMYAQFTPTTPQYIVKGWFVSTQDDVLGEPVYEFRASGAALSVVVPDTGLTLKPLVAIRESWKSSVKRLNASTTATDVGFWVSKLFRSQTPWRPLTAHVIVRPNIPVELGIIKDGKDAPTSLVDSDPAATVFIRVTSDAMRRLPPGQIQKSRFMRYMLSISAAGEISSVAIGSGATTMKGGH